MKFLFILDEIIVLRAIIPFYLHLHSHVIMSWKAIWLYYVPHCPDENRFSFCLANDLSLVFSSVRHGLNLLYLNQKRATQPTLETSVDVLFKNFVALLNTFIVWQIPVIKTSVFIIWGRGDVCTQAIILHACHFCSISWTRRVWDPVLLHKK